MDTRRFPKLRRIVIAVPSFLALALCVGLLVSCNSGSDPEPSASSSNVPDDSGLNEPTDDYTIPPRPENVPKPEEPELTAIDIDNAYELARYYLDLYPYVKATGDTTEWEKYAHPECEYCQTVVDSAVVANEAGAWSDFNLGVVEEATFLSTGGLDFRVDFLVDRDEIVYYGPEEEVRTDAGQHTVVIGLKEVDGELKVRSFDILVPEVFGVEDL
ncbi:hypothetical protein J2S70_001637 [Trueperella bonasi]|uniref:DUF6318 domain-containing protein n=1 Tax=Trueperella bonasi TaxID=312286 RepID=A0ABT9NI53_9ACTO|nr:DUF6318 family protein [Trueperella bonasi]MDP9807055.1 hypothetical protein [Trueperella bonasi]